MQSKLIQALLIMGLFLLCVVLPSIDPKELGFTLPILHEYNAKMEYGIIHYNSLLFVGLAGVFLYLSIGSDVKKANSLHQDKEQGVKEAENIFEDYFHDKITADELKVKSENNHIVGNVLQILKHGGIEEDLVLGMQRVYANIDTAYTKLKNDYEYLATVMPIIGMVGTIAGLLMMFAEPTQSEDFEKKFAGLSLALSTTLYASLITILWFKPSARSVERWQTELQNEFENLEISIRKFYHKVEVFEFIEDELEESQVENNDLENKEEVSDDKTKEK